MFNRIQLMRRKNILLKDFVQRVGIIFCFCETVCPLSLVFAPAKWKVSRIIGKKKMTQVASHVLVLTRDFILETGHVQSVSL